MDTKSVCYIVGAGSFDAKSFHPGAKDYIIAADGGYTHLQNHGFTSHMLLGDFDSLDEVPHHPNIIRHPAVKDDTDSMLAIKAGLSLGYKSFMIFGALGGRLDHTLANLQALSYLVQHQATAFLIGEGMVITAIKDKELRFAEEKQGYISVFCLGEKASGVYLNGFKYPLANATLTGDIPLGVSNAFTSSLGDISAKQGILTVLWFEDDFNPNTVQFI